MSESTSRSVPFSARISTEDAAFIAGLEIDGAHTPSDKLRALLAEARKRRQGSGDYESSLQLAMDWLQPLRRPQQPSLDVRQGRRTHPVHASRKGGKEERRHLGHNGGMTAEIVAVGTLDSDNMANLLQGEQTFCEAAYEGDADLDGYRWQAIAEDVPPQRGDRFVCIVEPNDGSKLTERVG